jgi:hypothetical protein
MKTLPGSSVGDFSARDTSRQRLRRPHREARAVMVNDCLPSGKKLPGHNGLAALSALPFGPVFSVKYLINHIF